MTSACSQCEPAGRLVFKRRFATHTCRVPRLDTFASHIDSRQTARTRRVAMYTWALQVKVPADPVWYHTRNRAASDSRSLCIVRVHGRHPHIIFQHGGRKDCSAGAFKTLDGDARCNKDTVSISFCAIPSGATRSLSHLSQRLGKMPRVSIAALGPWPWPLSMSLKRKEHQRQRHHHR